ncbi:arylsulfatase [Spongiibacter tropicus]|uniref:arylsulfatase n=1 Tax=Spongiibacter tropicus TaxID=454602 RepID=UPI003A99C0DF
MLRRTLYCGLLLMAPVLAQAAPPNIVLILADDLGFTDIQPFASEIATPSLAALADNGIRFTNHHVAASCAPTRAMLLTGVDSHLNGVPNIPEAMPPSQRGRNGYDGVLSHQVQTVATLLREHGYHTYVSGKWHLGKDASRLPDQRGFERSVILADSGADNWSQRPYLPMYRTAQWYKDGQPHQLPNEFYSSEYIVDQAIAQIDSQHGDGQPFFSYVAFQAVHIPVQVPAAYRAMYESHYQQGWSALREQRYRAAVAAGLVPPSTALTAMNSTADWTALSNAQQRDWARRMAVYAGMVQAMDHHIGRLVEHLKALGEYDNTVFVFMSDNGPEPADPVARFGLPFVLWMKAMGFNTDYGTLGERDSYVVIGPGFASAAASPLSYYKYYAGEGGLRVPMIIAGAGVAAPGRQSPALTHVTDIVPTLLDLSGAAPPGDDYYQPSGKSLLPVLADQRERVRGEDDALGYELGGNAALFKGDYKLVKNLPPAGDGRWHLYNIVSDPGESRDLSESMPERLAAMLADYEDYARRNGVLAVPDGYDQLQQVSWNSIMARKTEWLSAGLLLFVMVYGGLLWRRKRLRG